MTQAVSDTPDLVHDTTRDVLAGPDDPRRAACKGKVLEVRDGVVLFQPRGTNYELHLAPAGGAYDGEVGRPVGGVVDVRARKVYTVNAGGNFVAPILGSPRIIQGRVLAVGDAPADGSPRFISVKAGAVVSVRMPDESHAVELGNGPIERGALVNVVAEPGATFELVG